MNCIRCSEKLPKNGLYVECHGCENNYHYECSSLSEKTYKAMSEAKRLAWRCSVCKGSKDSVSSRKGSVADLGDISIEQHFSELKRDIEKSQTFLSDRHDEMLVKLNSFQQLFDNMNKTIESLVKAVKEKDDIIDNLSARLNHLEQYGRNRNLELVQVEECQQENLEDVVMKVANIMDINLVANEIEAVHRLPSKPGKIRKIIVQFTSRKKRDEFVFMKKSTKITNDDVLHNGSRTIIYVNENLTAFNSNLLWKTKGMAREKNYEFVWYRFGKILVRKCEKAPVILISRESDLEKFLK